MDPAVEGNGCITVHNRQETSLRTWIVSGNTSGRSLLVSGNLLLPCIPTSFVASMSCAQQDFDSQHKGRKPIIPSGLADEWLAHERWATNKSMFLRHYGSLRVNTLTAAEFVMRGPGQLAAQLPLSAATSMDEPHIFVFRVDSNTAFQQPGGAAMLKDFHTPPRWTGPSEIAPPVGQSTHKGNNSSKWRMLSYGTHNAGLKTRQVKEAANTAPWTGTRPRGGSLSHSLLTTC